MDSRESSSSGRSRRVYEEVVAQIEDLILKGEFTVGDRLPPERKLAEYFRVSRHSVREAIRALEERQVLKSHQGDGTYVLEEAEAALVEPLARAIQRGRDKLREIFQVRKMMEPQIASMAAGTISPEDVARLKVLIEEQRREMAAGRPAAAIDDAFHQQIARATANSVLVGFCEHLGEIIEESRSESLQSPRRQAESLNAHERIVSALERGDAEGARREMYAHLELVEKIVTGK